MKSHLGTGNKELWLVRHGESEYNAQGRFQGHMDVPLSALGVRQAEKIGHRLASYDFDFDGLYCSDLQRAALTAQKIAERVKIPAKADVRLREIHMGELQGLLRTEMEIRFPEFAQRVKADSWNTARPGGESMADVAMRVKSFVDELPSGRFVLVSHGGTIRSILKTYLGLDGSVWRNFQLNNTSLTRLTLPEGTAVSVGDVAHLESWTLHPVDEAVL